MKSMFTRTGASASLACAVAAAAFVVSLQAQAPGAWKQLFNGKDFTGWTVPAGGGGGRPGGARGGGGAAQGGQAAPAAPKAPAAPASTNPAERSWKVEAAGVFSSVPTAVSKQASGGLNTVDKYKDFELELEYKLDEAPTNDCTAKLGPKPGRGGAVEPLANLSTGAGCTFNSGISFRSGYQLNLGRREAGKFIGLVIHRDAPYAIRAEHVAWLSTGDCGAKNNVYLQDCSQFPEIRKKGDWNSVRITAKGPKIQAWLNGKLIVDVTDDPTLPNETAWREPQPINLQYPPAGEAGEFAGTGTVKYRNLRIRSL